jgi:hypothetical protein
MSRRVKEEIRGALYNFLESGKVTMKVLDSLSYKQKEDLGMVSENCTILAGLLNAQKNSLL